LPGFNVFSVVVVGGKGRGGTATVIDVVSVVMKKSGTIVEECTLILISLAVF